MYRRIKGTRDILPDEIYQWHYVENKIRDYLERCNYQEIRTPLFEVTELFSRSIGTDTDVVSKEMYTFQDKGHTSLTLRPELTAPVLRAYLQNHLNQLSPITKFYYLGPLFRQERPQKGRLRQFNQFGFEIIGSEHPEADAEIIQVIFAIYQELGINDLKVRINSIGSRDSRRHYLDLLHKTLTPHAQEFCATCQQRLERNILRLFDCKLESCQALLDKHAPSILEHLSNADILHFEEVQALLTAAFVPFEIDRKLVRGLDYYTRTTFEITSSLLGSQDAICGGGRYDHLAEDLDGPPTPAVGVASGMERLLMILNEIQAIPKPTGNLIYTAILGDNSRQAGFQLVSRLRAQGYAVEMDFMRRSLKAQMRDAGKKGADWVIIIGENEIQQDQAILKNMTTGEQKHLQLSRATERLESVLR